jgi:serine/threonine-protein kinase SRPK3
VQVVLDVIENSDVAQALRQDKIQNLQYLIYRDSRMNRRVALKVVTSAPRYTETALDETKLLQRLITSSPHLLQPRPHHRYRLLHIPTLVAHTSSRFWIISDTRPNGIHVCVVFELLGEFLLLVGLIKRHQNKGVPMHLVKPIAKQILLGLDYTHRRRGVIHTGTILLMTAPLLRITNRNVDLL